ncbi:hypothetical protein, partial [Streptomyces anulatus]|uniref:hypothetical protein n=1 Tax=Streptomyces anulatus TaxID=1892 RepID=UPI003433315B
LQNAYNAASDILGRIRDLFPFSPAKEGPFSGRGWTLFSGMSLAEGFADGMTRGAGLVRSAAERMAAIAAASVPTVTPAPVLPPAVPRTVQLAGQSPITTQPGKWLHIENFYAAANQSPDDIAERLYLLSIARGY